MKNWIKSNPNLAAVIALAIIGFAVFAYMHFVGDPVNWQMRPYVENWWGLMQDLISGIRTRHSFDFESGEGSVEEYIYREEKSN